MCLAHFRGNKCTWFELYKSGSQLNTRGKGGSQGQRSWDQLVWSIYQYQCYTTNNNSHWTKACFSCKISKYQTDLLDSIQWGGYGYHRHEDYGRSVVVIRIKAPQNHTEELEDVERIQHLERARESERERERESESERERLCFQWVFILEKRSTALILNAPPWWEVQIKTELWRQFHSPQKTTSCQKLKKIKMNQLFKINL